MQKMKFPKGNGPIMGFEPYFEKLVQVGTVHEGELWFSHGYYPPHKYGKKMVKFARKNNLKHNTN